MPFQNLIPGDTFTRRVGHDTRTFDMAMTVTAVVNDHLSADAEIPAMGTAYVFHRESGMEVDEDYGWGPNYGKTGSIILPGSAHHLEVEPPEDAAAAA